MRIFYAICTMLLAFSLFHTTAIAENMINVHKSEKGHHHRLIDSEKMTQLKNQGFMKQEIFMAAMLSKKSEKSIDEVLQLYKNDASWESVANKLGVDIAHLKKANSKHQWESLLKNHEEEVIEHLAKYNKKKVKEIEKLIDDETPLRFLVGASVMAKLANKDIEDVIHLKKFGKNFHEMIKELNIDEQEMHKELQQFKGNLKNKLKRKLEKERKNHNKN